MATRKVSITLDEDVLEEAKARAGERGLSAYLNEVISLRLQHERITEFLAEAEERHGPIPQDVMEKARNEWHAAEEPPSKQARRTA